MKINHFITFLTHTQISAVIYYPGTLIREKCYKHKTCIKTNTSNKFNANSGELSYHREYKVSNDILSQGKS